MINTTYLTLGEMHIKTYQELACSISFAGRLQQLRPLYLFKLIKCLLEEELTS